MIRRTLLNASAVFALGAASLGASAQTMVLKAADVHPAGYPNVVAVESMGKKLEAATNGRLKIQTFPGGVLGGEKEMIEQTQVGAINILRTSLARSVPWCQRSTCSTCLSSSAARNMRAR